MINVGEVERGHPLGGDLCMADFFGGGGRRIF